MKEEYPSDFAQANPFCAFCGKHISKISDFVVFHSQQRRKKYLLHEACAKNQEGRHLSLSEAAEARLQSVSFLNQPRSIALGGKEFKTGKNKNNISRDSTIYCTVPIVHYEMMR